jgi:hypothetical protein
MARVRSTSSGIMIASLGWALRGLRKPVTSRFSQPPITLHEPMPSVNASWAVCDGSASIICLSSMISSSTGCWARLCTTSTKPGRIKAASSRFRSHQLSHGHQIPEAGRFSHSRSWASSTMTIEEAHKFFQRRCTCQRPTQSASPCSSPCTFLSFSSPWNKHSRWTLDGTGVSGFQ